MLQVNREVEQQHGHHDLDPERQRQPVEQAPAHVVHRIGDADGRGREQKSQHDTVEQQQAEIIGPALQLRDAQNPPRRKQLPNQHHGKDGRKKTEPVSDFLLQHQGFDGRFHNRHFQAKPSTLTVKMKKRLIEFRENTRDPAPTTEGVDR